MLNSMTGFGRGEAKGLGYHFSVEMKSVNYRFQETIVKMPRTFLSFEDTIRKIIQEKVKRGRIEVYVNLKETEERKRMVKVDKDLTLKYDISLKELAQSLNTTYHTNIFRLVNLPEVLSVEEEEIEAKILWPVLENAVQIALAQLLDMRLQEGERLKNDLRQRIVFMQQLVQAIADRAPKVVNEYQERLRERLKDLLDNNNIEIDESRVAMEVALLADKASIDEEVVRLKSHLEEFAQTLSSSEPVGRKLDFLVQEMNREINTVGSKANDLEITKLVVEGKCELEKIREQIQNME
ncbi:MAG: YicC family protein [Peptococcaceae bacterium]|nr:YicC family protein [Peptococcaceae bacterium]